jgi:hypothetical protein
MKPVDAHDRQILRDLAARYAQVAAKPVQEQRRNLWRDQNSLRPTRPLIFIRGGRAWSELPDLQTYQCQDDSLHRYEQQLRLGLLRDTWGDDCVLEPWITVKAINKGKRWGLESRKTHSDMDKGSWKAEYPLREPGDLDKLQVPSHEIEEESTRREFERMREVFDGIREVDLDRGPFWRSLASDLSMALGNLRGMENFMLDMMDQCEWLHQVMTRLRDGVLKIHNEAEAAGDWSLTCGENQAISYSHELPDPEPNTHGVSRKQLWGFMAAQEFALVSPEMHDEFLLQYQLPILEHFGMVAYGCCEDLTRKIDMLRQIPNLRRIGVTPRADVAACAEQIGRDYVISWRPNPAEMVCCGFDEDRIRRITRQGLQVCRGLNVDITLKDIDTVQNDPSRLPRWAAITREVIEEMG